MKDHFKMTAAEKIAAANARLKAAKALSARVKKLSKREKNPMSESEFCDKYGFHKAQFNRHKNGGVLPSTTTARKYEKALKAEKV